MRTFDKLIATIQAGQGTGSLRSPFGSDPAVRLCPAQARRTFTQASTA